MNPIWIIILPWSIIPLCLLIWFAKIMLEAIKELRKLYREFKDG